MFPIFRLFLYCVPREARKRYQDILNKKIGLNPKAINRYSINFLVIAIIVLLGESAFIYFFVSGRASDFHYSLSIIVIFFMFLCFYVFYENYIRLLVYELLSYNEGKMTKGKVTSRLYVLYTGGCEVNYTYEVAGKIYSGKSVIGSWFSSSKWKKSTEIDIAYWPKNPKYSALYHHDIRNLYIIS